MGYGKILRPRGAVEYDKPALSHADLVDRMADRGLGVPDTDRAERYLRHVGYYRLSPYMIPFQVPDGSHNFDPGVTFDDVLGLYVFDRELRLLVLDAVERVEVAVRSAVTDVMAARGGPHWYTDRTLFADGSAHASLLVSLREANLAQLGRPLEAERSRLLYPSALEHYLTRYRQPEFPPSWIMVEGLTLGQLQHLYGNLAKRSDRQEIAQSIGTNEALLTSWLRTYARVRNICAHHGRLWNVGLGVYPKVPTSGRITWPRGPGAVPEASLRRLYPALVTLQSILQTISPRSSWGARLANLLSETDGVQASAMGVPSHWREDPFWRNPVTRPAP